MALTSDVPKWMWKHVEYTTPRVMDHLVLSEDVQYDTQDGWLDFVEQKATVMETDDTTRQAKAGMKLLKRRGQHVQQSRQPPRKKNRQAPRAAGGLALSAEAPGDDDHDAQDPKLHPSVPEDVDNDPQPPDLQPILLGDDDDDESAPPPELQKDIDEQVAPIDEPSGTSAGAASGRAHAGSSKGRGAGKGSGSSASSGVN